MTGFCVFAGQNLTSCKSKKQTVVVRSSAKSEYLAMNQATCVLISTHLFKEIGVGSSNAMELWCDNQTAIHVANNPVFH